MTKTQLLDQYARTADERLLLARMLDQKAAAQTCSVPAHTPFLSPAERAAAESVLAAAGSGPRHVFWGGYGEAERTVCVFLPDWMHEERLAAGKDGPVTALRAVLPRDAEISHRDVLGALTGLGIKREKIGDILVGSGSCDILLLRAAIPILQDQWEYVGRYKIRLSPLALNELSVPIPRKKLVRDSIASLRLDAAAACGFSLPRGKAAELISAGRVSLNHIECGRPDRPVGQGDVITCRGLGKCVLRNVVGQTKKGRIMLEIERYL